MVALQRAQKRWLSAIISAFAGIALALSAPSAKADISTVSVDSLRTGWDGNEPNLSPSWVTASDFGKQFAAQLDGQIYAQPIVAGGALIVATENNRVYGLDPATGTQKWQRSLGTPWPAATLGCGDLTPNIGITSTPVYDPGTGAVYLTTKVNDGPDAAHPHWYLHALNAQTGAERAGFPTTIQGSPTNAPSMVFTPATHNQRPGLLLLNGVIYMAFGGACDTPPYSGFVVGVNGSTGQQTTMWSTESSSANGGGIWQSGGGLASDGDGRILLATGNGVAPAPGPGDTPPANLGESVVRLSVNADGSLSAQSFFSPYDNVKLNQDDYDLGSGGPMALPASFGTSAHPHLLVQVGKDGRIYLLDADHLGGSAQGLNGTDAAVSIAGPFQGVWGHPAFWGGNGGYVYVVGNGGPLRALAYSGGATPRLTSVGTSTGTFGYTSGSPVVTSTGTNNGSALVWVVYASGPTGANAELRAYDAVPINGVLNLRYSYPIGKAAKFSVVATDSGHVYVGTRDGVIYGVGRPTTALLQTSPYTFTDTAVNTTTNATVTVTANSSFNLTGISATAPFGAASPSSPVPLAKGDTYTVPVSFTPTTWGTASGTLTFTTDHGTAVMSLTGRGTQPGLGSSPASLDFGSVTTGAARQLGVQIVNTGTAPETINSVTVPTAPFAVDPSSEPTQGTTLAPGVATTISVTFTPTTAGSFPDTLTVSGSDGTVSVPITGTAVAGQPHLSITPTTVDYGIVSVGKSVTQSFDVSNTGSTPLTITKAKAPTGVFSTNNPLAEGQVLEPGDVIHQSVTFTPTDAYPAQASYEITGNDGQSEQYVTLLGNQDPITAHYNAMGGWQSSGLGFVVSAQYPTANGGKAQDFTYGTIYWSAATGAWSVKGAIRDHYKALGGPGGFLGYPITDETTTPDGVGRYNHFSKAGSIYWTPDTRAWSIHGAIRDKWASMGWERGVLGYPTTDETGTPDGIGRFNHFTGTGASSIYWTPNTGAHSVMGAIHAEWAATGWELGPMGYPITDETTTPDGVGRYNHFSKAGSIYWAPNTGAHAVYGAIRGLWSSMGWERSWLGYPTSDEYSVPGGRRSNFQYGYIFWNASNGATNAYRY